jgi:pyrroline-5-carboxylate reductase
MSPQELTVLGAGNMGRALIGGLLRRGMRAEQLAVGEPREAARDALAREFGIAAQPDNAAAIGAARVVVVAVKPRDVAAVLQPLAPALQRTRPVVLSVAAGVRMRALQGWCGPGVPVIRAMPNRPALVGAGVTGLYAPAEVDPESRRLAERALQSVGEVVWVASEDALDAVTAVSGSGPAYFFLLAELLARAGTGLGLPPPDARRLAIATLHGAGLLAHGSDGDLARLRAEVTSKGGTTEAAVRTLEAGGFEELVDRAVRAAARRSRELAEQAGGNRQMPPPRASSP